MAIAMKMGRKLLVMAVTSYRFSAKAHGTREGTPTSFNDGILLVDW
jgi:hypothetical protein